MVAAAAEARVEVKILTSQAMSGGVPLMRVTIIQQQPKESGRIQYGTWWRTCGVRGLAARAGRVSMRMTIQRG
jgi:hypothetical protein